MRQRAGPGWFNILRFRDRVLVHRRAAKSNAGAQAHCELHTGDQVNIAGQCAMLHLAPGHHNHGAHQRERDVAANLPRKHFWSPAMTAPRRVYSGLDQFCQCPKDLKNFCVQISKSPLPLPL
jgi:hypothetical protein